MELGGRPLRHRGQKLTEGFLLSPLGVPFELKPVVKDEDRAIRQQRFDKKKRLQ